MVRPPRIIGHRGAAASAPENTIAGFAEAARQGARWVETDAKLVGDSSVILFHDDTLDRTTNGSGEIAKTSFEDIRALDAGSWFGQSFKGERVPSLAEAIAALRELELGCNFEIKPCPGRERETALVLIRDLVKLWPAKDEPPLISSFSRQALRVAREAQPDWPIGALFEEWARDWLEYASDLRAISIHCDHKTLTKEWARAIKDNHLLLLVFTVNEVELARRMFDWGADGVFTDMPGRLLEAGLG